jgi:hypothetical protein
MLKPPLCDLLGIDLTVICAPFRPGMKWISPQARDALARARNTATARR